MKHLDRCVLTVALFAVLPLSAAEADSVLLEDFRFSAWPVRWTTLEFSKFTPPQLVVDPDVTGPDGNAAGRVELPQGGRILLRTQVEAPEKWYGIRGKPPWLIPAGTKRLSLAVKPAGSSPVRLVVHLHDADKKKISIEAGLAKPGKWTTLSAVLPAGNGPIRLHSVELTRQGQPSQTPQPVWIDTLQAEVSAKGNQLFATYGMQSHDRSLVVGDTARMFLRLHAPAGGQKPIQITYTISRRGHSQVTKSKLKRTLAGQSETIELAHQVAQPGVYDVTFGWPAGMDVQPIASTRPASKNRNLHRKDITFTVYRKKPLGADQLEDHKPNLQRTAQAASADFQAWRTNLSPALLLQCPSDKVQLFAGMTGSGLALPKYVAYSTAGGVRVVRTDRGAVKLAKMNESWLLFFAGDEASWRKITIFSAGQRESAPLDLPWLVVLQNKPDRLAGRADRLVLEFTHSAGAVSVMPLYGIKPVDPSISAQWVRSLPKGVAGQASTWARRLKRLPYYVREDYKIDAAGDVVTIRQKFYFHKIDDQWGTKPLISSPIAPMLTLARRYGMEIELTDAAGQKLTPISGMAATGAGPYEFIQGSDEYQYTVRGVLKYINEDRLPNPSARGPIAEAMIDHMRNKVGQGEPAASPSRWSPGITIREDYGIAMVGNSERQGLLGSTIPYCDDPAEALWRKRTLAVDAGFLTNPHCYFTQVDPRSGKLYNMEGFAWTRFGLHNWVDNNAYIGDVLRALEYYVKYTGDLDLVRRHWPKLRASFAVVSDFKRHGEWELSCFDTGGGDTWDSTYNGTVAFARLADQLGDGESYQAAAYYHAKRAITLAGQRQVWKFVKSMGYWASLQAIAQLTEDGHVVNYSIFGQKWVNPVATLRDMSFTDVWGQNMGLRPWNQTGWMRGSRSEFRMIKDLTPSYGRYWADGRVKAFAPEWYQAVIVDKKPSPTNAIDRRTGKAVKVFDGDFAGKVTLAVRAIVSGDSVEDLYAYWKNKPALRVYGETSGRVPRLCSPAVILEDGMGQPWVRLYGKASACSSDRWQRGRDAVMDLGDENYMYGFRFAPTGANHQAGLDRVDRGVALTWRVFAGPDGKSPLRFGYFGPLGQGLAEGQTRAVTWNTTVFTAKKEQ